MTSDDGNLRHALENAQRDLDACRARVEQLESQFTGRTAPVSFDAATVARDYHVFDALMEGCQVISFDWRYLYVNDAAAQHGREAKADLVGRSMLELYPGIETTAVFARMQQSMQQRTTDRLENEFAYPDGSSAWFEIRVQPVPEGIVVLSLDITERRQSEHAREVSEQRLRLFVENAPAAIAMFDKDMRYLLVSERWLADFRLTDPDVIGRSHYDVFPDIPDRWREIHQRCLKGAVERNEADPFPHADGSLDWVRWEVHPWRTQGGAVGGLFFFSEVISERVQAEEKIRQSEARYRLLADNMADVIWTLDSRTQRFSYVSPSVEQLRGFTPEEVLVQPMDQVMTPASLALIEAELPGRIEAFLAGDTTAVTRRDEVEQTRKDGSTVWTEVSTTLLRVDNQPLEILGVSRDISERKRAEDHIRRLNRVLSVLSDVNQAIVRVRHLPDLFAQICAIAVTRGEFPLAWIGLLDPDRSRIKIAAQSGLSEDYLIRLQEKLNNYRRVQGPAGIAVETRRRVVFHDILNEQHGLPLQQDALDLGCRSLISMPLIVDDVVQGIFTLFAHEPGFFDDQELRLLDEMAMDVSFAIEVARQEEQRRANEDAIERYGKRFEILHQIDAAIIRAGSVDAIAADTIAHIQQLIPCQEAIIVLNDEAASEVQLIAGIVVDTMGLKLGDRVPTPPGFFDGFDDAGVKAVDDLQRHPELHSAYSVPLKKNMRSILRVLMKTPDKRLGVLTMNATDPDAFSPEHQEIAVEIANQLAIAIQQQQLTEQLARHARAVEEMSQFLRTTLDAFPANTAVLDPAGTILAVNRAWEQFADENDAPAESHYLGSNYLAICDAATGVMSAEAPPAAAGIRAVIAGQQADFSLEYACNSRSLERWFLLRVTPFDEPVPRRVVVAHLDISARRQAEHAEHEQRVLAEALRDSLAVLTGSFDVETVLRKILDYSATVIPSEAGTLLLFEEGQGHIAYTRGYSPEAEAYFKDNRISLNSELFRQDPDKYQSYLAEDTRLMPEWISYPYTEWIRSSIGVQIVSGGEALGLLIADSATPNHFTQKDVENLQAFARYASLALENAYHISQLERWVSERTADLQEAKARVEAILNSSADGILLVDAQFAIKEVNQTFSVMFRCGAETCVGHSLSDFIVSRDDDPIPTALRMAVSRRENSKMELRARRHDGAEFDAEMSLGFVKDDGFVCSMRDITERKAQERQLRFQASVQENVSDAVIVTNLQFQIQTWNKAAERIYGWRAEEVMGKTSPDILRTEMTPEDRARTLHGLYEQGWWQAEVCQRHKDGSERSILGSITLLTDENDVPFGIVAVNRDITERKRIEEALEKSAAEIQDLYSNAPNGYHSLDKDGVIVQINETELRWLGYNRDEVLHQRKFADFLTPDSLARFRTTFPHFIEQGSVSDLEFDVVRRDGSTMHVLVNGIAIYDENGVYSRSRSSLFDITAIKKVQRALEESEARYRLLAENVTDVIAKIDLDDRRTFVTPSCYALTGYAPEELVGRTSAVMIHPDDLARVRTIRTEALASTQTAFTLTQRLRHKDGHYLWVEVLSTIIRDANTGQPIETVAVIRDVTERKRAEEALQARLEEERAFQYHLKGLYEITIELTQIDDLDTFYRRTVELGRSRLGFERLAMFLFDERGGSAIGTYGTDANGQLSDERHIRFFPDGIMVRAFERVERFYFDDRVPLFADLEIVGYGWNAATVLWSGTQKLGWFVADNLLTGTPASKAVLDILGLYALAVGTLLAQKQVQLALRESEARYRLLADHATDLIVRQSPTGEFIYVSPSSGTVVGYAPEELLGRNGRDFIHPDDFPYMQESSAQILGQSQVSFALTFRFRHKEGHYIWLEASGRIIYSPSTGEALELIESARDITQRKQISVELEQQRAFLQKVIDVSPNNIFVKDSDSRFLLVNPALAKLYNVSPDAMIGKTDADFGLPESEVDFFMQVDRRVIESGEPLHVEEPVTVATGETRWFETTKVPITATKGAPTLVLGVSADITEHKQLEESLRKAVDAEKELNELKSRFVSMASHEFRTPLATILALTETLQAYRRKLSEADIDRRLDRIKLQIGHLNAIMEDMLLLARMQSRRVEFQPVETDLDGLCRLIIGEFADRPDITHEFVYQVTGASRDVRVDGKLVRQIITNLISNAVKYSPQQKSVGVTLAYDGSMATIKVSDQGIGIPEADLKYLFEPFHRAANVGTISGTGLGLVIAKEAVELHGGTIAVESQVDVGTTFTISLPIGIL